MNTQSVADVPARKPAASALSSVQPYLFFNGRCDEALAFYRSALDAEVTALMRFKESPMPAQGCGDQMPPGDKVMHASFRVGSVEVLASDGHCDGKPAFQGFSLALTVRDGAEAERRFNALAAGGQVVQPLAETFFSPRFGMVTDRFGVMWMVLVTPR